ncbi:ribonuclease M5 [Aminipila luticellarii]|mgnify:CR=1 FL=1|uniref:Ribonuclease M5 n=1 Tax=Aminipila luticellarii TaxID=2507160 RepID=A0A410PS82_9FIRM|nr:ribonuclease M5 [Aminipila luticellarii]QAT41780.1 ribonuclease M5 [Aminipila luticellarii]
MESIAEVIIVEGRDDQAAVKRAIDTLTIATHGYGIRKSTWELIEQAYDTKGIIIFTDPDFAGEEIRRRLREKFPNAKHAYLSREDATAAGDIGIENAKPAAILEALEKAHCTKATPSKEFSMQDLMKHGLAGGPGASDKRGKLGKALGIGYGNSAAFLNKLNQYGIARHEFEEEAGKLE